MTTQSMGSAPSSPSSKMAIFFSQTLANTSLPFGPPTLSQIHRHTYVSTTMAILFCSLRKVFLCGKALVSPQTPFCLNSHLPGTRSSSLQQVPPTIPLASTHFSSTTTTFSVFSTTVPVFQVLTGLLPGLPFGTLEGHPSTTLELQVLIIWAISALPIFLPLYPLITAPSCREY